MTDTRILTLNDAAALGELIHGVESHAKLEYYANGTDSADSPVNVEMRAFTHEGGGFISSDEDVRDAHIWTSGIFEHWYPVMDLIRAIQNIDGRYGLDQPIAIIR
jgi:hypothetical protein